MLRSGLKLAGLITELREEMRSVARGDRIVIDPKICDGKPVIKETRVPVSVVLGSLGGGMTFEEVQGEYDVTADDIRAALRFAAGRIG